MARLPITPQTSLGGYPATPLTVQTADFVFTPAGAQFADGASFPITGRELLLVRNGNGAAQTVTITSMVDEKNRLGTITAYSVGISEYAVFGPFQKDGWAQAGGLLYFAASATDVEFAVLRW